MAREPFPWFSMKSKSQREREQQRYGAWAFPYGPAQQERVRGLLYLSDGFGTFPQAQPDYPVTFLIPREQDQPITLEPSLPDWVTPLWLDMKQNIVQEARA